MSTVEFRDKEIESSEHNISEAFKMKRTQKRDVYIRRLNKELHKLRRDKEEEE